MTDQPERKLVPMTREEYGDLGRANYADRTGFELRWDEMPAIPAERPKPGHIATVGLTGGHDAASEPDETLDDAWDVARRGDSGRAILVGLVLERERHARTLHRRLVDTRDELDRAARSLEDGKRAFVLSRSSSLSNLPQDGEMLQLLVDAVHDAKLMAERAERATPESVAFRLATAADALDTQMDALGMGGDTLASAMRGRAAAIHAAEERRVERERREREEAAQAALAERVARPLGVTERKLLAEARENGYVRKPGRAKSREGVAFASLVERKFIVFVEGSDSGGGQGKWELARDFEGRELAPE